MKAQMSSAAWEAGFRNAAIVSAWFLPTYIVLLLFLHFLVHLSWQTALGMSFSLFLAVAYSYFMVSHIRARLVRGAVLLDCGYRPMMWANCLCAILFPFAFIWYHHAVFSGLPLVVKLLLTASVSSFYLIMGLGRMQMCTHGIWIYAELIKWERIKSYEWQDNALLVEYHSRGPIKAKGVLSFPPDCKWSVDLILQEHLSPITNE